jgi:hypothetical protein
MRCRLLIEQAQRIDKGAHFAPHGNHAQTDFVANQNDGAGSFIKRFQKES